MLSRVLKSRRAVAINIPIMRVYARMREMLLTHKDILLKLEQLESQVGKNSHDIQQILAAWKALLAPPVRGLESRLVLGERVSSSCHKRTLATGGGE